MEEMRRLAGLGFAYGLMLGGALAQVVGDFLVLVSGGIALGSFAGAAWTAGKAVFGRFRGSPWRPAPDWATGTAVGALIGGLVGLVAAVADAIAGG